MNISETFIYACWWKFNKILNHTQYMYSLTISATFYNQACVSDFIIDILVGSTPKDIRECALEQFFLLSQTVTSADGSGHQPSAQHFMLNTLCKARLPFWVSSCSTRSASQKLLKQCSQYFDLRCRLVQNLSSEYFVKL